MSLALARQAPYPVRTAQRRCSKCGKLVSRAAYACRRCGKGQRVRPRIILLGLAGCLLVGMFAFASASALVAPSRPGEGSPAVAAVVPALTPPQRRGLEAAQATEIGAGDLWLAYARDPAGSERSFRDRPLLVTGTVRSVDRDFEGHLVARLDTGDAFETVNATLATRGDPAAWVNGLNKGRAVSLLCVGRGLLMGAPLLGGCFVR
jgi:tRNA_anti-like